MRHYAANAPRRVAARCQPSAPLPERKKDRRRVGGAGPEGKTISAILEIALQADGEVAAHIAVAEAGTGRTRGRIEQTRIGGIAWIKRRTGVADILYREVQRGRTAPHVEPAIDGQ